MTVRELRAILENELIDDDLIIYDYEDNIIDTVNLVINNEGAVNEIRFAMTNGK